MTEQYQRVRKMTVCPSCLDRKEVGLVLCWQCHREQKRENDGCYSPKIEQYLRVLEGNAA